MIFAPAAAVRSTSTVMAVVINPLNFKTMEKIEAYKTSDPEDVATELMKFDKTNTQKDYQYMARSKESGKLEIGYVVVDKPWCYPPEAWRYYIVSNKFKPTGFCGGSTDLGLFKVEVLGETIVPFNQTANILYNKEIGMATELVDKCPDGNTIRVIGLEEEIPYELWS